MQKRIQLNMEEPTAAHEQLLAALRVAGEEVRLTVLALDAAAPLLPAGTHVTALDLDDLRQLLRLAPESSLGTIRALPGRVVRSGGRIAARFAASRLTEWEAGQWRPGVCFRGVVELLPAAPADAGVLVRFTLGYALDVDREQRVALQLDSVTATGDEGAS